MTEIESVARAYKYLEKRLPFAPETLIVLGSGLGAIADTLDNFITIPYGDIPGIKPSTTPYHKGTLMVGTILGKKVAVMSGRIHLYEGNTPHDVVRLIRALSLAGLKRVILTNSAGGVNPNYKVGDLVRIIDHVSLFVPTPIEGDIRREIGTKLDFPDMSEVYDLKWGETVDKIAEDEGIPLKKGVYVQLKGAQYETPAEIKYLSNIGIDLVGMSTVIEAMASRHLGLSVCAFSVVTNMASGLSEVKLSHEDVKVEAIKASDRLKTIIMKLIEKFD